MDEQQILFKTLGVSGATFQGLETFPAPKSTTRVTFSSDELTAFCPITGQPDLYHIEISMLLGEKGLESKSLKLYLQTFRSQGVFAELLAEQIKDEVVRVVEPLDCFVTLVQSVRGGLTLKVESLFVQDGLDTSEI